MVNPYPEVFESCDFPKIAYGWIIKTTPTKLIIVRIKLTLFRGFYIYIDIYTIYYCFKKKGKNGRRVEYCADQTYRYFSQIQKHQTFNNSNDRDSKHDKFESCIK